MDDVARKLGVSKGALYLYFAGKEELFEAICPGATLGFKEILYSTFSENKNPLESAGEFFDKMLKQYGSNSGLSFEIFSEASTQSQSSKNSQENPGRIRYDSDGYLGGGTKEGLYR